jgi:hypothetical protein
MKTPIAIFVLVLAISLKGDQTYATLEVGGKVYTNCTIELRNPAEAILWFDGGGARVKIEVLPGSVQKQLHYSPEAAQRFWDDQKQEQQEAAEKSKKAAHDATEQWKQQNCRIINGDTVKISDMLILTGAIVAVVDGCPVIQTFATNNTYTSYYVPPSQNGAISSYFGLGDNGGWRKRLVSSEIVPSRRYVVKHCPVSAPLIGDTITIRALQLPGATTNVLTVDCGEPYKPN